MVEKLKEWMADNHYTSVAICGYRKDGRKLYQMFNEVGIPVEYIIERNYEALSLIERTDLPIVGFDSDIYDRADVIILTSDLPENVTRECLQLAGITVPLLSYKDGRMETLG